MCGGQVARFTRSSIDWLIQNQPTEASELPRTYRASPIERPERAQRRRRESTELLRTSVAGEPAAERRSARVRPSCSRCLGRSHVLHKVIAGRAWALDTRSRLHLFERVSDDANTARETEQTRRRCRRYTQLAVHDRC